MRSDSYANVCVHAHVKVPDILIFNKFSCESFKQNRMVLWLLRLLTGSFQKKRNETKI